MTDVRKTLLGAMQHSSLFAKKRTDWSNLASGAAKALQADDNDAWRLFCDQVLKELPSRVDTPTLKQLADDADKLRKTTKREARIEFAKRVIALATGEPISDVPELTNVTNDAFVALERRKQEVTARLRGHRVELDKLEALQREVDRTGREVEEAEANLESRRARIAELRRELAEAEREWAALQTVSADEPTRDIGIIVGYLKYPAVTGHVPLYPIIVCEFENAEGFKAEMLDRMELEIDEVGRYKLFTPGNEDAPFAETDEPVDPDSHREFQRLSQHWGHWFLRVQGSLRQWDFQIIGDKVFPLSYPIEQTLDVIELPRKEAVKLIIEGSRHKNNPSVKIEAEKLCDRYEALVGKLPVKRSGLKYEPGIIHAQVIQRDAKAAKAFTQWVRLDADKLESQLKKILGGAFIAVGWESVRTGVDFMQLMPQNGVGPNDVWVRAKRNRRPGTKVPQKLNVAGSEMPLEEFQPDNIESFREEDVGSLMQFYRLQGERFQKTRPARIETSAPTSSTEVDRAVHEAIVQNYLRLCQVIRLSAQGNDANAQRVWPMLRDAVIFEMPTAAYTTLHEEFFRYCVRSAKVDPDLPLSEHTDKQRKRVGEVISTGMDAPFPEKMPFRACFFAYGAGVRDANSELLELELRRKETGEVPPSVGKLYGHLVTETGVVISFRHLENAGGHEGITFTFDRDPTSVKGLKWDRPHTMTPWIVNALVAYVNEHKRLVEQRPNGFAQQSLFKKTAKGLSMKAPIPPPFYVVFLKDEYVREQARQRAASIKRHIDWQHRWNVRGHDCVRFVRGELPLDPEVEKDLLARKYKIFTVDQPDSETFMALAKRGVPPKATNEWLAVLMYWRDSFTKGPEDKPLIESVRRSTKGWGES